MTRFGDGLADTLRKLGAPAADAEAMRLAGNQIGGEALGPSKTLDTLEVTGEARLEGDVLIGRDVGVEPNVFWDASDKQLRFRTGKTTVAHLSSGGGLAQDGAKVHRGSTQALSSAGSETFVSFSSAVYDDAAFWAAGDPTKLTVPVGSSGRYQVGFYAVVTPNGTNPAVSVRILRNAETEGIVVHGHDYTPVTTYVSGETDVFLDGADYLRLGVVQTGSSAGSIRTSAYSPEMHIRRIR